jgi:hypothetical protein
MRRSEMLEHIKEDLLEKLNHRWLERGETDKWAEFTANELLDMIEGFGMLPPLNDWDFNMDGDKATADNVRYYTWEPEE